MTEDSQIAEPQESTQPNLAAELLPVAYEDLQVVRFGDTVSVFCRGFCFCSYAMSDRSCRNYCIVQLHIAGGVQLRRLSRLFSLGYQQCSNIVSRYRKGGLNALLEKTQKRYLNRRVIDEVIGEFVLGLRDAGKSYKEISEAIRFQFKKKVEVQSIRAWVHRSRKKKLSQQQEPQLEMFDEALTISTRESTEEWHWNKYAGSMILYSAIEWSGMLRPFEELIAEDNERKNSGFGVRRVLLTLFFLHALRLKSIEQTKHLVGDDFGEIVGGDFLRGQWLRYGVDRIAKDEKFNDAVETFFRRLINLMERGDDIFFTDGHFSSYYGKRKIPKGYDPRRQIGFKGRNTIFLHNSQGEIVYLFESPTNTSLSNDIGTLVTNLETLGMDWKGKALFFDRGGYSAKCFRFLHHEKKMHFVTYLKNRKKERRVDERLFKTFQVTTEEGEEASYRIYEKPKRETSYGEVRIVILLADDGKQIPIITNHPSMKMEDIVYFLQRRWREENCFKYMIEHFGIDLLTTYKTEDAPEKIIKRTNPERTKINQAIAQKKKELEKLQIELGSKIAKVSDADHQTVAGFMKEEEQLRFSIKNVEMELGLLELQRSDVSPKLEINLKDEHVIISQKRRLLINAIKAMNYNAEKWLQSFFKQVHYKADETLSLIRNLWQQPGEIRSHSQMIEVKLRPLDSRSMQESLMKVLMKLQENNQLRLPDGRGIRFV